MPNSIVVREPLWLDKGISFANDLVSTSSTDSDRWGTNNYRQRFGLSGFKIS